MRFSRPDSLRGLIIMGTLLVATPLSAALVHSTLQMRALSSRSARLVAHTAESIRAADELARAGAALERAARLRLALGDPALDEVFAENAARATTALEQLHDTDLGEARADADAVGVAVTKLGAAMRDSADRNAGAGDETLRAAIGQAQDLSSAINRISQALTRRTALSLEDLQASTAQAESRLFQELALLMPLTVLLVVAFLSTLYRPLRRIDRAIDALGRGDYDTRIQIRGPSDLVKLGTQLEWLRQRLIEVAEAKNRFLRHMSHELKTPLASIREGTELLLEGAVGTVPTEQREVIGILRDNGIHLQRHIENLLSYSAWEARAVTLDLEEFLLRDLIRGVIDAHRMTLLAHRLRLTVEAGDFMVVADRGKLRLILDNLFSNAVKYTPHDGSITVRAAADGEGLVIDVIDSGPGIAPEDRSRLFDPFYTGRSATTGPLKGTGIGLSVVLEFTEAHGGTVTLIDSADGGAHFRLRLPAYPRPVRQPVNPEPA
mgnify:CR=1 FL=1